MNSNGTAYVIRWVSQKLPDFINEDEIEKIERASNPEPSPWSTLCVSGGRRDKISKGDIAGLFLKQGGLSIDELGLIEIKQECAYVAVLKSKVQEVIVLTNNQKLKTKKVRINEI